MVISLVHEVLAFVIRAVNCISDIAMESADFGNLKNEYRFDLRFSNIVAAFIVFPSLIV